MKKISSDTKIEENILKNALFTAIVNSTENAIISKTLDGLITSWNLGAEKLFGYSAEEMMGQPCAKIVPDDGLNEEREILKRIQNGEIISPLLLKQRTKKGNILDILWSCFPIKDEEGRIIGLYKIAQDITARKKAEQQQQFLLKLSDAIHPFANPAKIQECAAQVLGEHLGVTRCFYTEVEANNEYCVILPGYYQDVPGVDGRYKMEDFGKIWLDNLSEGQMVMSEDVKKQIGLTQTEKEALLSLQIAAQITVPLIKNGRFAAMLTVNDIKPRKWSDSEIELLKETAERTWAAVERAKAEEALHINEERMRRQKEAFQSVVNGASLAYSLNILSDMMINETEGEARTAFYMANDGNTELHTIRGAGNMPDTYADEVDGFLIGPDSIACGLAVSTKFPVLTSDVKEEPTWKPWVHIAEQNDYRSCWSFPIHTGDNKAMGTFAMYFKTPREATAKDLTLADVVTKTASVIISSHIEIQQRAEAEKALRASEEQLRHIKNQLELSISAGKIGLWNLDFKNNHLQWSKEECDLFGITEDEFQSTPEFFWKFVNPTEQEQLQKEQIEKFKFQQSELTQQFSITRKDGEKRWLESRMKTEYDAQGQPKSATGVNIDITEEKLFSLELEDQVQKRTEEISRQKDFIETIINSTPNLVAAYDTDMRIIAFNKACQDYFNMKEEDVIGKIYTEVFPAAKGSQSENDLRRALNGETISNAVYYSPITGRHYTNYISPLRNEEGETYAAVIIAHDITENVNAVEKIKQSEEKFSKLFESSPFSISVTESGTGKIVDANENFIELTGFTREEIIEKTAVELNLIENEERDKIYEELVKNSRIKNLEVELKVKSGMLVPIMFSSEPITIGKQHYFLHAFNNITERKKSEKEIERKNKELEKMNKELQAFNYVSSHDLQEPLRKIQTFAMLLLEKENQNLSDIGKNYFQRIQYAAARMQTLIQDLLTFSRLNTTERKFEPTNLSNILAEVESELTESITEKNAIVTTGQMCEINMIPFQFRQLFHNLLTNSLKFSKPDTPPHITINCQKMMDFSLLNRQSAYHISYADNGIGFEQQFSEQIFQVFQRLHSKEEYPGTGIGLAIVKKIVENHNGVITVTSELGKGTKFDIYIPA